MSNQTPLRSSESQQSENIHSSPEEGETSIIAATAVAAQEKHKKGKQTQVHHRTHSNQNSSKKRNRRRSKEKLINQFIDIRQLSQELTPNYIEMSEEQFKNLLFAWHSSDTKELEQHLSNRELLSFTQKYAQLLNMRYQLEMEQDYWKYVLDELLSSIKWLSQMPKNFRRQYSINWHYPRTESNVRHRQTLTENKLNQIRQQIQIHLQQQQDSSSWSISNKTLMDQKMEMLNDKVKEMVELELEELHWEIEHKKVLIQNDAKDIDLLKSFFDLDPTKDQKINAAKIWQRKYKSDQREIQQVATNSSNNKQGVTPTIFNGNDQQQQQQYLMTLLELFDLPMRTIIENRQQNMENRTQQINFFQNVPRPN